MRRFVPLLLGILLPFIAFSNPLHSFRRLPNGVSVRVDSLTIRLLVCDERTFRVTVLRDGFAQSHSQLVVTKKWVPSRWKPVERDSILLVSTGRASARIEIHTGSISFFDEKGRLLLREHPQRPHEISPATVEGERVCHVTQRFILSDDEGIYGLGQFEDGTMNYR